MLNVDIFYLFFLEFYLQIRFSFEARTDKINARSFLSYTLDKIPIRVLTLKDLFFEDESFACSCLKYF